MNANLHFDFYLQEDCVKELENTFRKSMKVCLSEQLDEIANRRNTVTNSTEQTNLPFRMDGNLNQIFTVTPKVIHPSEKLTIVSAVDSSVIYLTRTKEGKLYAAKSGIVISAGKRILSHLRLGPMLIHITEEFLQNSKIECNLAGLVLVDSNIAKRLTRIRLERAIQLVLSRRLKNSIILIDGALKPSIFEDGYSTMQRIIEISTMSNNDVIGLSKNTNMTILLQLEKVLKALPYPACVDIAYVIKSLARNTMGNNFLVKLGKNEYEYVFRADICPVSGNDLACLGRLIGNDMLFRSYPESLRIAHHVSIFTNTEVSSLKGLISRFHGKEDFDQATVRKNVLGVSSV